ncbi:MAG: winged helix-turn-helix transcriptional regulator [Caldiserica bacterium]|nr:winged helix-turn-helix transcriptional regulator [Caldisericota bacterium]
MGKAAALALTLGITLIGGAVALALLGRGGAGEFEAFRDRSLDYVAAFAEAAAGWLAEGERGTLEDAARFMLLGSAVLVEVVWRGEEVVREGRGDLSPPALAAPPSGARAATVEGGEFLEVLYPLGDEGSYVRVWLEVPFQGGRSPWAPIAVGILAFLGMGALGGSVYLARGRRPSTAGGTRALIEVGSLTIDEGSKEVRLCGRTVKLSPKQYALLVLLAREPGRVFSDREILRELWPDSRYANSKDVKQYVYLLRRRLGEVMPGAEALIATVPGFGYKLLSPEEIGLTER